MLNPDAQHRVTIDDIMKKKLIKNWQAKLRLDLSKKIKKQGKRSSQREDEDEDV